MASTRRELLDRRSPAHAALLRRAVARRLRPASAARSPIRRPARRSSQVAVATADDVEAAVEAAHEAFLSWSKVPAPTRARRSCAGGTTWWSSTPTSSRRSSPWEQGKPLAEARAEVLYGAAFIEWFAEESKRLYGEVIPTNNPDRRMMTTRNAVGVTAAITPWNFPAAMILRKAVARTGRGLHHDHQAGRRDAAVGLRARRPRREGGPPRRRAQRRERLRSASSASVLTEPRRWCARSASPAPPRSAARSWPSRPAPSSGSPSSSAATRRSSSSTMPTSPTRSRARSTRSSATPGRPACAPTASTCRTASTTASSTRLAEAIDRLRVGDGREPDTTQGPLISQAAVDKVASHIADAIAKGATVRRAVAA